MYVEFYEADQRMTRRAARTPEPDPEPDPTELPAVDFTEAWGYDRERADYSD